MKRNRIVFLIVVLFFGAIYLVYSVNQSLTGRSISTTLSTYSFEEIGISLLMPDDWSLFDTSNDSANYDDIEKFLIIEGGYGMGGLPWVKIYQFITDYGEIESIDTHSLLDMDVQRIQQQYQILTLDENEDIQLNGNISFEYLKKITILDRKDRLVLCKDWVVDRDNNYFLISICATYPQWAELDQVSPEIIDSITYLH